MGRGHAHQVRWEVQGLSRMGRAPMVETVSGLVTLTLFLGWMPPKCWASQSWLGTLSLSHSAFRRKLMGIAGNHLSRCRVLAGAQIGFPLYSDPAKRGWLRPTTLLEVDGSSPQNVTSPETWSRPLATCLTRETYQLSFQILGSGSKTSRFANTRKETSCVASTC
jgi:hypothetical protein